MRQGKLCLRGTGPSWSRTTAVVDPFGPGGRTKGRQLAAGPEVDKVRRELANYQEFVTVSAQIVEVNEAICEARPISGHRRTPDPDRDGRGKGGLVSALQAEFTAEVTRLAELTAGSLSTDGGNAVRVWPRWNWRSGRR